MNHAYTMRYHYCGPPLRDLGEFVPERDSRTLREKMNEAASSRARDAVGNLDLLSTCALIFDRTRDLPRIEGKQYIINILDQQNPRLELVEEDAELSSNYLTSQQIHDWMASYETRTKLQKPRRKGWTNKFLYGKHVQ